MKGGFFNRATLRHALDDGDNKSISSSSYVLSHFIAIELPIVEPSIAKSKLRSKNF